MRVAQQNHLESFETTRDWLSSVGTFLYIIIIIVCEVIYLTSLCQGPKRPQEGVSSKSEIQSEARLSLQVNSSPAAEGLPRSPGDMLGTPQIISDLLSSPVKPALLLLSLNRCKKMNLGNVR